MKLGTLYAGRIKKAFAQRRQQTPAPEWPTSTDPLDQLGIATLAVAYGLPKATKAVAALMSRMAGWNEVRVSRPEEINRAMSLPGDGALNHCQRIVTVLEGVYERENALSLSHLLDMGRREAKQYLDELPCVDEYSVASVTLWSLNGHGIPVDDALLVALRKADLVYPEATRSEVQAFLERNISAADAKAFCLIMDDFKAPPPAGSRNSAAGKKKATAAKGKKSGGRKKSKKKKRRTAKTKR